MPRIDHEWSAGRTTEDPDYPEHAAALLHRWMSHEVAKGRRIPANVLGAAGFLAGMGRKLNAKPKE